MSIFRRSSKRLGESRFSSYYCAPRSGDTFCPTNTSCSRKACSRATRSMNSSCRKWTCSSAGSHCDSECQMQSPRRALSLTQCIRRRSPRPAFGFFGTALKHPSLRFSLPSPEHRGLTESGSMPLEPTLQTAFKSSPCRLWSTGDFTSIRERVIRCFDFSHAIVVMAILLLCDAWRYAPGPAARCETCNLGLLRFRELSCRREPRRPSG